MLVVVPVPATDSVGNDEDDDDDDDNNINNNSDYTPIATLLLLIITIVIEGGGGCNGGSVCHFSFQNVQILKSRQYHGVRQGSVPTPRFATLAQSWG